ncbi:MAG: hypothetical protein COA67_00660 [Lutibacter sp.]|nr:MAG: hypothetical protein COA67_00660 [Lutibacter sp.]
MKINQNSDNSIHLSIKKGLIFLNANQLKSGEFISYRSTDPKMIEDCEFDSSPFPTALICYCLSFSEEDISKKMIENAIQFLLSEMEANGIWRYWTKQHQYHGNIPPDLDDIACVSSVLKQNNITFPNNEKILLANRNNNDLFYTWIVPRLRLPKGLSHWKVAMREGLKPFNLYYFWKLNESKPNDIDGVVNANVLNYLGESKETESVVKYLMDIVRNDKEENCDKWHLSKYNYYYFLSKNYYAGIHSLSPVREICIRKILSDVNNNGTIGKNILETALAICTLLNWSSNSEAIQKGVNAILQEQTEFGNWKILPFYYGGPKKYFGWGSKEITTAFCLEALTRYIKENKKTKYI